MLRRRRLLEAVGLGGAVVGVEGKMGRKLLGEELRVVVVMVLGVGVEGKMVFRRLVLGLRLSVRAEEEADLVPNEASLVGQV